MPKPGISVILCKHLLVVISIEDGGQLDLGSGWRAAEGFVPNSALVSSTCEGDPLVLVNLVLVKRSSVTSCTSST